MLLQKRLANRGALPRLRGRGKQGNIVMYALLAVSALYRDFPPVTHESAGRPRACLAPGPAHHGLASEATLHRSVSLGVRQAVEQLSQVRADFLYFGPMRQRQFRQKSLTFPGDSKKHRAPVFAAGATAYEILSNEPVC